MSSRRPYLLGQEFCHPEDLILRAGVCHPEGVCQEKTLFIRAGVLSS